MANVELGGTLTGSVTEDTLYSADGMALATPPEAVGYFIGGTFYGMYGTLEVDAAGRWTYRLNNALPAVQSLKANTSARDQFILTWVDSSGDNSYAQGGVDIEVRGWNDAATVTGELYMVLNALHTASLSGAIGIDDVDTGEKEFQPASLTGSFGSLTLDKDGNWRYDLLPGVQTMVLDEAKSGTDTFELFGVDGTAVDLVVRVVPEFTPDVTGTAGIDNIPGSPGNQVVDGAGGIDTMNYVAARGNFIISRHGQAYSVTDNSGLYGADTLVNVERLQFSDRKLALDLLPTQNAGQTVAFIGALAYGVHTAPNPVGTILSLFDAGYTMTSLSQLALDVGLVRSLAGSNSNADLARLVFRNVIGQEADADTVDLLAAYMDGRRANFTQAEFIAAVAGLEANLQHVDLVGLQQTGLEFV